MPKPVTKPTHREMLDWQYKKILSELSQLQLHGGDDTCPCSLSEIGEWCVPKHSLLLNSLALETAAMDLPNADMLYELADVANDLHEKTKEHICNKGVDIDVVGIARNWRKKIEPIYYSCSLADAPMSDLDPKGVAELFKSHQYSNKERLERAERGYYETVKGYWVENPSFLTSAHTLTVKELRELDPETVISAKYYSAKRGGVARRKLKVKQLILPELEDLDLEEIAKLFSKEDTVNTIYSVSDVAKLSIRQRVIKGLLYRLWAIRDNEKEAKKIVKDKQREGHRALYECRTTYGKTRCEIWWREKIKPRPRLRDTDVAKLFERHEGMTEGAFRKLEKGDHVEIRGEDYAIQYFAYWDGKKWRRSSRKRANGAWVWNPKTGDDGYIHRSHIKGYLPAPLYDGVVSDVAKLFEKEEGEMGEKIGIKDLEDRLRRINEALARMNIDSKYVLGRRYGYKAIDEYKPSTGQMERTLVTGLSSSQVDLVLTGMFSILVKIPYEKGLSDTPPDQAELPTVEEVSLLFDSAELSRIISGKKCKLVKDYYHCEIKPKEHFDSRSFRVVTPRSGVRITIGCPKGSWSPSQNRCKVGTETQRIMYHKRLYDVGEHNRDDKEFNELMKALEKIEVISGVE